MAIETVVDHFVIVFTDGSCQQQANPWLRRAGYSVVYDVGRQHARTISKALPGLEQTAQRAELRAVLAALAGESRQLRIKTDSSYVACGLQNLLDGASLPFDGEHLDLWHQVHQLLQLRFYPVKVSWVKGHASDEAVSLGFSTLIDIRQAMTLPTLRPLMVLTNMPALPTW